MPVYITERDCVEWLLDRENTFRDWIAELSHSLFFNNCVPWIHISWLDCGIISFVIFRYAMSIVGWLLDDELEMIWKEAVVTEALSWR
jgi:hypothetical protein